MRWISNWMTGGENQPGSWDLKTEKLGFEKARVFDSYEPFPVAAQASFPEMASTRKSCENDTQVWPPTAGIISLMPRSPSRSISPFALPGDKWIFLVNMTPISAIHDRIDPTLLPTRRRNAYGQQGVSARSRAKRMGYQYFENGSRRLVYYPGPNQWRKEKDNPTGTPFVDRPTAPGSQPGCRAVWTGAKSARSISRVPVLATRATARRRGRNGFRPGTFDLRALVRAL